VLLSQSLCVGDGKCVAACPLNAIKVQAGSYG
jgi:NAD-dependent dihydropyrimidine dehydrogenase PreA subunit